MISNKIPHEIYDEYLKNWIKYENLAKHAEKLEYNIKQNTVWKILETVE